MKAKPIDKSEKSKLIKPRPFKANQKHMALIEKTCQCKSFALYQQAEKAFQRPLLILEALSWVGNDKVRLRENRRKSP